MEAHTPLSYMHRHIAGSSTLTLSSISLHVPVSLSVHLSLSLRSNDSPLIRYECIKKRREIEINVVENVITKFDRYNEH